MNNNNEFIVKQDCTLDFFWTQIIKKNIKILKKLIVDKNIYLNNQIISSIKQILKINDVLIIKNKKQNEYNQVQKNNFNLIIIYEDNNFFVFNKPSGLLVDETNYNSDNTLKSLLLSKYDYLNNLERAGIVHRLDKDTSGLIIVAKNQKCFEQFKLMFQKNEIIRKYLAIVHNHFNKNDYFKIETEIGFQKNNKLKMTTVNPKNPKKAITLVKLIENLNNNLALVECELKTGRTHQIRVHMNYINHPVLNDPLYSNFKFDDCIKTYNQYLHCYYLKFFHPITFKQICLETKMPNEFLEIIKE